jgi:nucleoid-associated protein YgaU
MIRPGSRYQACDVVAPTDVSGLQAQVVALRSPTRPGPGSGIEHLVVAGERLDQIAFLYYGDPTAWWRITDANPEVLHPLDLLRPGRRIAIPPHDVGTS